MNWPAWVQDARDTRTDLPAILHHIQATQQNNRQRGTFVFKLYLMLLHPAGRGLMEWTAGGTALCMPAPGAMDARTRERMADFLQLFFRHGNVTTLQRQFNFFDFVRDKGVEAAGMRVYRHPHFVRDAFDMTQIVRKTNRGGAPLRPERKRAAAPCSAAAPPPPDKKTRHARPAAAPRRSARLQVPPGITPRVEPAVMPLIAPLCIVPPPVPEKVHDTILNFGHAPSPLDLHEIIDLLGPGPETIHSPAILW